MGSRVNRSYQDRELILFGRVYDITNYTGGVSYFKGLSAAKLHLLMDLGFADPEDRQNNCPTIKKVYKFLQKMEDMGCSGWTAHGYAVAGYRDDYRISIEGVAFERDFPMTEPERHLFEVVFGDADEFECGDFRARAWFD